MMCASPQSANAHSIGWRVMANTPFASAGTAIAPSGLGIAGLPTSDPSSRMEAMSMMRVASAHGRSPTGQSIGVTGAAR